MLTTTNTLLWFPRWMLAAVMPPVLGFLQFLPAIIGGVSALLGGINKKKQEKNAALAQFQQQEQERQRAFDEAQNSSGAQANRMAATLRLGRLYGYLGGRDKAPKSLVDSLSGLRTRRSYTPDTYVQPKGTGLLGAISSGVGALMGGAQYLPANFGANPGAAGGFGGTPFDPSKIPFQPVR